MESDRRGDPPKARRRRAPAGKRPLRLNLLPFALVGAYAAAAGAAGPLPPSLDFGLHLSRVETSLSGAQQPVAVTVKQVGIAAFNTGEPPLQPGLLLGYAYLSPADQPLTAGMELQGFYIGPALRGVLVDGPRFAAALTGIYLYQQVKGSDTNRTVTMEWQQPQIDLDLRWCVARQTALLLGGRYGRVDADEKSKGDVEQSVTLRKRPAPGYRAGLEFELGDGGQAGILLQHAIGDGAEIYFQRQF